MTTLQYPTFAAGQKLTAALLTAMDSTAYVQAADMVITSNTTLANTNLAVPVVSGGVYIFNGFLIFNGGANVGNFKTGWTAPGGSTLNWQTQGQPVGATTTSGSLVTNAKTLADLSSLGTIGTGTNLTAPMFGRFTAGANGTLQFQVAQVSSSATSTTFLANSWITVQRYA